MKEQIEYFLVQNGYSKLQSNMKEFRMYFQIESGFLNAVFLLDLDERPDFPVELFQNIAKNTTWQFAGGGDAEVHMLSIILSGDLESAKPFLQASSFCWLIDTKDWELVIEDGQAEDFYGLKEIIMTSLRTSPDEIACQEEGRALGEATEEDAYGDVPQKDMPKAFVNQLFLVVNILVFLLCFALGNTLLDKGAMNAPSVVDNGEWYRMFTAMFLHVDIDHLVSNMLVLSILGSMLERTLGHVRYLILYLAAGLLGGGFSLYCEYLVQDFTGSVGASGAIFGIVGALFWILLRNRGQLETMSVPKILFLIGYSLYSGLRSTNVDNAAHIGGLVAGFLICMILYRRKNSRNLNEGNERA